jgi:predicted PurR-regulated permease PerM
MQRDTEAAPWKQIALFLITLGTLVVIALIVRPFLAAIVGAIVIAVITERPYQWLATKIKHPNLCAVVGLILITLSIVVPIFFLAQNVGNQIALVVKDLRKEPTQRAIGEYFTLHPALASRIMAITNNLDLSQTAQSAASYLGSKVASFIGVSIGWFAQVIIMLFILFYAYRDHAEASTFARSLLPLNEDEAKVLLERLRGTIYATALGRMAIAAIQGTLGGLAYWLLGVPNSFLWGILTALMAMIPALGAFLVWMPVALYLGFTGYWIKAALLVIWGGGIVSTIDNFLYPTMVGPQLRQHSVIVLLSILGGIALFGVTGIILGPIAFTTASTLLEFWKQRTATRAPALQ